MRGKPASPRRERIVVPLRAEHATDETPGGGNDEMRRMEPAWHAGREIHNYTMAERTQHDDFGIRNEASALPNPVPHRHDYFQIHVNLAGSTQHYLGARVRPIAPGTVSFVLPYRVHFIPTLPGASYYLINVSQSYLLPGIDSDPLDLEDVSIERAPELAPFKYQEFLDFTLEGEDLATVTQLSAQMLHENEARGPGAAVLIRAHLLHLIGIVCRRYGSELWSLAERRVTRAARRDALVRLTQYIRDNFDKHLSLTDAAAAVNLSPTYLAHLVKKETGKTFLELLTQRRLERAKELIAHTALPIAAIAEQSGFADLAYFTRRFKQLTGVSPSRFRTGLR